MFHEQPLPKLLLWGLRHTFPYPRTSVEIERLSLCAHQNYRENFSGRKLRHHEGSNVMQLFVVHITFTKFLLTSHCVASRGPAMYREPESVPSRKEAPNICKIIFRKSCCIVFAYKMCRQLWLNAYTNEGAIPIKKGTAPCIVSDILSSYLAYNMHHGCVRLDAKSHWS